MKNKKIISLVLVSVFGFACNSVFAEEEVSVLLSAAKKQPVSNPIVAPAATTPILQSWMSPEVGAAWNAGYKGQGVKRIIVDDFTSADKYSGKLSGVTETLRHGEWTSKESGLIAPSSTVVNVDYYTTNSAIPLSPGLNVVNASYALLAKTGYSTSQINFGTLQNSIINSAKNGTAIVTKAAGNYAVPVNGSYNGNTDYLNLALKGAPSAIFVGALNSNGTTTNKATLASYSNTAGTDATFQRQFLVVGVEGNKTGLYGTSFAAPIVNGYADILGSKFTSATPTQITNQLLNTARTDTIQNYNAAIHGRGEASLTRALAPISIR